jgi:hypothetical protein
MGNYWRATAQPDKRESAAQHMPRRNNRPRFDILATYRNGLGGAATGFHNVLS